MSGNALMIMADALIRYGVGCFVVVNKKLIRVSDERSQASILRVDVVREFPSGFVTGRQCISIVSLFNSSLFQNYSPRSLLGGRKTRERVVCANLVKHPDGIMFEIRT